jgi:hypothetical protein
MEAMPLSATATPASWLVASGSSRVNRWATMMVKNGTVPLRMAATPEAMSRCPQMMSVKGTMLLMMPSTIRSRHWLKVLGGRKPSTSRAAHRKAAPPATLSATMVSGGSPFSAKALKKNDAPQIAPRISSSSHCRAPIWRRMPGFVAVCVMRSV